MEAKPPHMTFMIKTKLYFCCVLNSKDYCLRMEMKYQWIHFGKEKCNSVQIVRNLLIYPPPANGWKNFIAQDCIVIVGPWKFSDLGAFFQSNFDYKYIVCQ